VSATPSGESRAAGEEAGPCGSWYPQEGGARSSGITGKPFTWFSNGFLGSPSFIYGYGGIAVSGTKAYSLWTHLVSKATPMS
jgi:hypothetical protein